MCVSGHMCVYLHMQQALVTNPYLTCYTVLVFCNIRVYTITTVYPQLHIHYMIQILEKDKAKKHKSNPKAVGFERKSAGFSAF